VVPYALSNILMAPHLQNTSRDIFQKVELYS